MVKRRFWMAAAAALLPLLAYAHGAGYERLESDTTAVRYAYVIGEPMADANVVVYTPDETVWQRGRTDQDGRFGFVPNSAGVWVAEADDGLGHRVRAEIPVGVAAASAAEPPSAFVISPRMLLILLIISLAGNAALLSLLLNRRNNTGDGKSAQAQ